MAATMQRRRRTFFVNKSIQLRFLGLLLLQMCAVLAGLAFLVRSHLLRIAEIAAAVPNVDTPSRLRLQNEILDTIHGFGARSTILLLLTGAIIALLGLLASHRLAGPAIKLQGFFNRLADGDISQRIAFRGTDYLDSFAGSINSMMESIERRRIRAGQLAENLARKCDDLAVQTDRRAAVAEMRAMVVELKGAV